MTDTMRETIAAVYKEQSAGVSDGAMAATPVVDAGSDSGATQSQGTAPVDGGDSGRESASPAPDRARDESGKFAKASTTKAPAKAVATSTAPPKAGAPTVTDEPAKAAQTATEPPKPATATTTEKAPQALKAMTREKWATLPEDVREDFARRERDHKKLLDESAEHRKQAQTWREAVASYEPMLKAQGLDPVKATAGLMQMWGQLNSAPAPQKADIIANLIRRFGVPAEAVGQALQAPPQAQQYRPPQIPDVAQLVEQKIAERLEAAQAAQAEREIAEFGEKHEFFEDVRADMGAMAAVLEQRGVAIDYEDLYNKAIALHPEISSVVKQREAVKHAATAQATTQRAQAAASSVRSSPAAPPTGGKHGDLKSTIAQIYREQQNR